MDFLAFGILHLLVMVTLSSGSEVAENSSIWTGSGYAELYKQGMEAYSNGQWSVVVDLLVDAIADYKDAKLVDSQCRIRCQDDAKQQKLFDAISGELSFLRYSLHMQTCQDECASKFMRVRAPDVEQVDKLFEDRAPYNYLQFAYHQIQEMQKAANAAITYYELHPNDELTRENLLIFARELHVNQSSFVSLEQLHHVSTYKQAIASYNDGDFKASVPIFEEALTGWYKAYDLCIADCENRQERTQSNMRVALFSHYVNLLQCRATCRNQTSIYDGRIVPTMLAYHYHYLQFSFFQLQQYEEAMMAAQSYALFQPKDDDMKQNIDFYQVKLRGILKPPRERALQHYNQVTLEKELFDMAEQYTIPRNTSESTQKETEKKKSSIGNEEKAPSKKHSSRGEDGDSGDFTNNDNWMQYRDQTRWRRNPQFQDVELSMDEKQLNGSERAAFDGVATKEECKALMKLIKKAATSGDGYSQHKDSKHPFTEKESFEGVTVQNVVEKISSGEVTKAEADLYLSMSERVRVLVEEYFDMPVKLHFAYTHLVCRHAEDGASSGEHLSHPIHSDNCILNADGAGTCPKRAPAYTERDFSSILFLNDDFEGGKFMFADHDGTIQKRLQPASGRLVMFSNKDMLNLHGVLGITKGSRCSLPMWFTLQQDKAEIGQYVARKTLALLQKNAATEEKHRIQRQLELEKSEAKSAMNMDKVDLEINDNLDLSQSPNKVDIRAEL